MRRRFRAGGLIGIGLAFSLVMGGCDFITNASHSTAGFAAGMSLNGNGRFVSFVAHDVPGSDLVAPAGGFEVFVRDLRTGAVTGISQPFEGSPQGGALRTAISGNGQVVAFADDASNLVPGGDTNGTSDVFVRAVAGGPLQRLSQRPDGVAANSDSRDPSISADGSLVAFSSAATDLVPGQDDNGRPDVYVANVMEHTIRRVSTEATAGIAPAISADGRFVVYSGLGLGTQVVLVTELATGTTTVASVGLGGAPPNSSSAEPTVSADGRYVAFRSGATNLAEGATGPSANVFRRDLLTGTTAWVSVAADGGPPRTEAGDNPTFALPRISANGRFIAFLSNADNLAEPSVPGGALEVFVRDISSQHTTVASADSGGSPANGAGVGFQNKPVAISGDGRYVAFGSDSTNLIGGEQADAVGDVYVRYSTTATIDPMVGVPLGTTTTVELHGTGFLSNATLSIGASASGGDAQISGFTVIDPTTARFTLTVPANANTGLRTLTLTNIGTGPGPGANSVVSCADCISLGLA